MTPSADRTRIRPRTVEDDYRRARRECFAKRSHPGERRRYTKRFLATQRRRLSAQWTERGMAHSRPARSDTASAACPTLFSSTPGRWAACGSCRPTTPASTVDQWATLLPVSRDGAVRRHVFEDCAHWWALAHYCLAGARRDPLRWSSCTWTSRATTSAFLAARPNFDPDRWAVLPVPDFPRLALIDFAFVSLGREPGPRRCRSVGRRITTTSRPDCSRRSMPGATAIWQPTKDLDWRCDPVQPRCNAQALPAGRKRRATTRRWTTAALRRRADTHLPPARVPRPGSCPRRPHQQLIEFTGTRIAEVDLAASLDRAWALARDVTTDNATSPVTPLTRIARRCALSSRSASQRAWSFRPR